MFHNLIRKTNFLCLKTFFPGKSLAERKNIFHCRINAENLQIY